MKVNKLLTVFKFAVSFIIIYLIIKNINITELKQILVNIDLFFLVISISFSITALIFISSRWHLLLKQLFITHALQHIIKVTYIGYFVGQVMPTSVGGDLVRGYLVWDKTKMTKIIISLVTDRVLSLFVIILFISLFSIPLIEEFIQLSSLIEEYSIYFIILVMFTVFILSKYRNHIHQLIRKIIIFRFKDFIKIINVTILGHLAMIASAYFLSIALGIDSNFLIWVTVIPVVVLFTALPISINGWGIRDIFMIIFLGISAFQMWKL